MRFLACALLVIATTHAAEVCNPGEHRQDGENICFCLGDGTGWTCVPGAQHFSNPLLRKTADVEEDDERCEPGTPFKSYCNTCFCGPEGRAIGSACTMMACDENVWNKDGTKKVPSSDAEKSPARNTREVVADEDKCEPGKPFMRYCNLCGCGPEGRADNSPCTLMACDLNVWNKDGSKKVPLPVVADEDRCEPGKPFMRYCNFCSCEAYGRADRSPCTQMACDLNVWNKDGSRKVPFPDIAEEDRCEPGKPFKRYCNTCTCGPEGRADHAACTMMSCDLNVWNKDGSRKPNPLDQNQCQPGQTFKRYCNTCTCGSEGRVDSAVCTMMACDTNIWNKDGTLKILKPEPLGPLADDSDRCEPGKPFMRYCNTCFCGPEGRADYSPCTYLGCDMNVWNKNGTLKNPVEFVPNPLVRKARAAEVDEDRCEPGKLFRRYCNICSCGPEGRAASSACTLMACDTNIWNKDGTRKDIVGVLVEENQDTCEPGKRFKYYCNQCYCGPDGRVAHSACTKMACSPEIWNKDGSLKLDIGNIDENTVAKSANENEERCVPRKSFKQYCNTCTCGPDGLVKNAACTRMYCDPKFWNKDGTKKFPAGANDLLRPSRSQDFLCQPGYSFQDDCNTCTCGKDGKGAACTFKFCPDSGERVAAPKVCEPGKNFKIACNQCMCSTDGTKVACTKMACPEEDEEPTRIARAVEFLCQPGYSYNDDCNTCTCGRDGKSAACTLKACLHDNDERVAAPKVCEPGKNFKIACNQCRCSRDGTAIACTKMACPELNNEKNPLMKVASPAEFLCQPGYSYKDDCNTCTCGRDGKSAACTLKGCLHDNDERVAAPKVCEPGKNFKIACNQCRCSRDGTAIACTKMACPELNNEKNPLLRVDRAAEFLCQPGYSYKDDCNTCTCGKDGKSAACTLKGCLHDNDERVAAPKVCEPGKNFKIACNQCRCSRDGTAIACTKMACPELNNEKNPLLRVDRAAEFLCQPGYSYNDDCNTCTCGQDGKSAACTLKACLHDNDERVAAPKVCQPGKNFKIACNQCRCSRDGTAIACTKMACPKPNDEKKPQVASATEFLCQPGYSYNDDCNTCTCGRDGKSAACTLKACLHDNDERVAAPKVCQPGKNFKIACNQCRCSRDGTAIACTKMACPKLNDEKNPLMKVASPAESLCQPGYSYYDGCNTCTCGRDGKSSACTLKYCFNNDAPVVAPKVCEPEKNFKIDCNQCRCSRDGTSVACTKMACPPHVAK